MHKQTGLRAITYEAMQNMLINDMCIMPCKKTKVQLLSKATNTKKLDKGKFLIEEA